MKAASASPGGVCYGILVPGGIDLAPGMLAVKVGITGGSLQRALGADREHFGECRSSELMYVVHG
jgi:hypothetical protein